MTGKGILRKALKAGCIELRQKGSHLRVSCAHGRCFATIPMHAGKDVPRGTLGNIEKSLAPCLGDGWLGK